MSAAQLLHLAKALVNFRIANRSRAVAFVARAQRCFGRMRSCFIILVCMGLFCVVLLGSSRVAQTQEFSRAQPGYVWSFPRDHGSHPLYQTEWWYYTGQLYAPGKEPFRDAPEYGFQLTFFRRSEGSGDATHSEYMAHAALTDIAGGRTYFSSRRGGGALGLATTSNDSLGARSGDWTVDPIGGHLVLRFTVDSATSLGAKPLEVRILTAELPPAWLQGENGFSKKAICDSCASMYYSLPRIGLQGRVVVGEGSRDLQGLAWMDHEFMTSSLGEKQVGWDWFGLMLKDGRSIMLFQLRNVVGGIDFVSGAVQRGGAIRALTKGEFSVLPIRSWRSPVSGAQYPIEWRVSIPAEGIDTVVRARVSGCEVGDPPQSGSADSGSVQYWEGPVASADESVTGYLEMTGYVGRVGGV